LSFIERTQRSWHRIAELDHAKQLVFRRIITEPALELIERVNAIVIEIECLAVPTALVVPSRTQ